MTMEDFFDWWKSQLAELVPAGLKGTWQGRKTTVLLKVSGTRVELSAPPGEASASVGLPTEGKSESPPELVDFLATLPGTPQRIRLVLPTGEYLVNQLTLPRAARAHLAEAVGYQLPQLTPFASDQLYYACGETTDSPADGPISVWLVAIPRKRLDRALALIGQTPPSGPLPLKAPPSANEALELSWRVADTSSFPQRRRRFAWAGLAVLWIGVLAMHLHNTQDEQAELDKTLDEVRARASEVANLRDRLATATEQADWLTGHKQSSTSVLLILDTLSEQLDDQTWLQGLDLQGRRLVLRGLSSSPATLIETLEASDLFESVRFDSAITRDNRGQGDRFNISAELEAPAGGGT